MKLMKTLLSVLAIASVVFLSSCGDDDPKPKTKTEIISAKTWKITRLKITVGSSSQEGEPEDCLADDIYTFEADGDYKFDEGTTKCDSSDPQSSTGKWEFNSDETILRVTQSGITLNYTIVEFTETKIRVKFDFVVGQTIEATYEPK